MDDVWSWLAALLDPVNWPSASPSLTLASATDGRSIALSADCTAGSNSDTLLTLSLTLHGFPPSAPSRALWFSDPLPSSTPHFPLVSQLMSESISLSPSPSPSALAAVKLAEDRMADALSEADKSTSALLCLALLLRLFWLCATNAPATQ